MAVAVAILSGKCLVAWWH